MDVFHGSACDGVDALTSCLSLSALSCVGLSIRQSNMILGLPYSIQYNHGLDWGLESQSNTALDWIGGLNPNPIQPWIGLGA